MTLNATNSTSKSLTASAASVAFTIYNNGTSIGTITFATSNSATISITSTSVSLGDHLFIQSPSDTTNAPSNISIKLTE
jgi:hypothetical protein